MRIITIIGTEQWDEDMIQDYIEAESEEEAIDFAMDYIDDEDGKEFLAYLGHANSTMWVEKIREI